MDRSLVPHRPDQSGPPVSGQREDAEKVRLIQINVQFPVNRWSVRLDIGDVEELSIGAARITGVHGLPH